MDAEVLVETRRSLHGVAELVIAGPQYRRHGEIRMRVTPGGFRGVNIPVGVEGVELVWAGGRAPLSSTCRELASAAGLDVGAPGIYSDTSGVDPDEPLAVDADAAALLEAWFERGGAALQILAPDVERVLWPEHFDLGISVDEVNYGVSPGDAGHPRPYAYVGPWTQRQGEFWNASFGAIRRFDDLPDDDAVAAFFAEGRAAVAASAGPSLS